MPTARDSAGSSSLRSMLIVAGGDIGEEDVECTDAVEIFKPDTSQWYKADPLPTPCIHVCLTIIGNICYASGGIDVAYTPLNQVHYASIDDLLQNAVPAHQSSSGDTRPSAWKRIADTPTYGPAVAVQAGRLLAIGGKRTSNGGAVVKEVYVYSSSTDSWIYISDLPGPRYGAAAAVLLSTDILVIGGSCGDDRMKTVYKGLLQLKP